MMSAIQIRTKIQTDRLTDRQTDRQTGRQTHRHTDRQTDRHGGGGKPHTGVVGAARDEDVTRLDGRALTGVLLPQVV